MVDGLAERAEAGPPQAYPDPPLPDSPPQLLC